MNINTNIMNVTAVMITTQLELEKKEKSDDKFPTHEIGILLMVTCVLMIWSKYYCMAGQRAKINKIKSREYEDV